MKNKLVKNFFYQGLYQITLIILPIVTIPIVSHALGAEGIGIYNYITSIITYFILFAGLGLANYGIREIALVKGDKNKLSKSFWNLELFNIFVVIIVILVYIVFLFFVNNRLYFLISGITLLATLFDISWFYYGIEDFKSVTTINLIIKLLSFISIVILIKDKDDLGLYFLIQSLSVLLSNLSLWIFLIGRISFVKPSIKESIRHFKPALKYFIGKISITLYTNMNKTLLGLIVSSVAVGIYSNSLQLITIFVTLIGTMDTVLMPHMTNLYAENSSDKMIRTMEKSINIQLYFSVPLMFGINIINSQMIPWFFGKEFILLNKIVPIFSPLIVVMPLGISIVRQYLIPMNRIRQFNISVIIAAIVSVVLNMILLPILGIWGSVISTVVSEFFVTVIRLYDLIKYTDFTFNYLNLFSYIISSIVMYISVSFLTKNLQPEIMTTIIQVMTGFIIYFLITLFLKKNIFIQILKG